MADDDIEPGSREPSPSAAASPVVGSPSVVGSSAPPPPAPRWAAPPAPPTPPAPPPPPRSATALPAPPPPTLVVTNRWRSLQGLTTALVVFLALAAAAAVFGVVAFAARISALSEIIDHGLSIDRVRSANDADDLVGAAAAIMLLLSFVILVLIIIWTFRAAKNNEALGRVYPRLKPGWAIAGWLIPLANLVIPVLILQDLWRGSDAGTTRGDPSWRSNRGSALIAWYWAAFLLSSMRYGFGRSNARFILRDELRDLRTHDTVALLGMIATIAAAILAIQVVRRIAARQEECLRAQQAAWASPS